jgi:hypothetical protein
MYDEYIEMALGANDDYEPHERRSNNPLADDNVCGDRACDMYKKEGESLLTNKNELAARSESVDEDGLWVFQLMESLKEDRTVEALRIWVRVP